VGMMALMVAMVVSMVGMMASEPSLHTGNSFQG
jgi:hypothetical protein